MTQQTNPVLPEPRTEDEALSHLSQSFGRDVGHGFEHWTREEVATIYKDKSLLEIHSRDHELEEVDELGHGHNWRQWEGQ